MAKDNKIFKCTIVSPAGKLLDCQSVSVVFTAHDGSVGILHNHMPMLCELGLGIMEITPPPSEQPSANNNNNVKKNFALIDGGFALIASNTVNIIASDAVCCEEAKREKIEHILLKIQRRLIGMDHASPQYMHEKTKSALLEKLLTKIT